MHPPIIVFSHLRWNFVFQRPQHLLTRLAADRAIFFFEEPVASDTAKAFMEINHPAPNISVYRPHTPVSAPGFSDDQLTYLHPLINKLVKDEHLDDYVVWFYTPMALPLVQSLAPKAIIYDCMDELSMFHNAPRQLVQRETALMKCADLVLTGGPSLYAAKKDRHPDVHCFSSSVDAEHFAKALDRSIEAPEQSDLPGYRLGYFGVIDERIDLGLIDSLARRHPEWQIVMVGPVVKINPEQLPHLPNIHYFGQKAYDELPGFLAGWDVCLLPFALNDATRFISPTKTLEYMAAEKPIVSTPITDVAEVYSDIVYLGGTRDEFINACETALVASDAEKTHRINEMRKVLAKTSWNSTAAAISALIAGVVQRNINKGGAQISTRWTPASDKQSPANVQIGKPDSSTVTKLPHVIIGAGPTGLSAAYHLGPDSLLLEQNSTVGGWCRSINDNGFTFDYAGHIMFSNDDYVQELYQKLLGENIHWQNREAWIYSKNVYTRYPFQGALYGLPPKVIRECIMGAIEARFGDLKATPAPEPAKSISSNTTACKSDSAITDCCADGLAEATAPLGVVVPFGAKAAEPRNFEEFIYQVWGAGIAKHFAIPYNRKIWAVPLNEMETSWLGGRVPLPDLQDMIEGALSPVAKPMGPNARFGYPLKGGFQALMDAFLPHLEGKLEFNTEVAEVSPMRRTLTLANGRRIQYKTLISTMPLPKLVELIGDEAPREVQEAAKGLRHTSVRCVNIGVGRGKFTDKHWIYYPEDSVFHRIFVQGNASPHCNPPGGFGFTCEITYSPSKPLPCEGKELIRLCINDAIKVGFIKEDDEILTTSEVDMPYAYVVYDHARARNVETIRSWLQQSSIILSGRYSEWEYYNSDHAFLAGKKAAETVRKIEQKLRKSRPAISTKIKGSQKASF
ncbi:MAG: FAD-dependent oxidoreductase [Methylobacter sp.]|nr:FAD-dependent oxidoreductase [Methylobacter sp.]